MPAGTAVEAWNWQVWETFPKADSVWVGFFESEKDAFAWIKAQAGRTFIVNNVPPTPSRVPLRPVAHRSKVNTVGTIRPARTTTVSTVLDKPVKVPVQKAETKAQKALKTQAKTRLDKHVAAEAKDLAENDPTKT